MITRFHYTPFPKYLELINEPCKPRLLEDCIFKNISSIKRNNIEAYLTVPSQDDEAVGKIAQLYILECFLNNKQIHNVLDRKEVKMIEDDETLNSFP